MGDVTSVPMESAHITEIVGRLRPHDAQDLAMFPDPSAVADLYAANGVARTLMSGDLPIAVYGVVRMWAGVGEWWSLTTNEVAAHSLGFHRTALAFLDEMHDAMGLRRVQAAIRLTHEVSINWHLRLGFEVEGTMRAYGPDGEDYVRMARLCHS